MFLECNEIDNFFYPPHLVSEENNWYSNNEMSEMSVV